MICPTCGPKDCKEWHICVLNNSLPVCEDCCSACRYRKGYRCGYRREETDHRAEIYKLDRQRPKQIIYTGGRFRPGRTS